MSMNHSQQLIDALRFASLIPLIGSRSIAVIGASSDPTHAGGRPTAYMLCHDYIGQIFPVNPNHAEIQGPPIFASVAELLQAPDVAIIAVPVPRVLEIVRVLGRQGARSAIVSSSGFNEVGEVGMVMQDAVIAIVREHGIHLFGLNVLGAFNSNPGHYVFFSISLGRGIPLPGRVGTVIQSDAYGAHLLNMVHRQCLEALIYVTTGNEADTILDDSIGWLVESLEIDVMMAYAESIRNADSFLAALEAVHRAGKPVILRKIRCNASSSRVMLSHTASLAGDDKVLDTVLGDYTVVRTRTTRELIDTTYLAARRIYLVGSNSGMIIVSGSAGIIVDDVVEEVDLSMLPMPDMVREQLEVRLFFASSISPVDCTAQALNGLTLVCDFTESMVVDDGYHSPLVFSTQAGAAAFIGARLTEQFWRIEEVYPERPFMVPMMDEGEGLVPYEEAGFALFEDPTRAVVAIQTIGRFDEAFVRPLRLRRPAGGLQLPISMSDEAKTKHLLTRAGIESAAEAVLGNAEEAVTFVEGIGYPVVLRLASVDIQHKSETGGMLLDISNTDAVRVGFQLLLHRAAEKVPQARLDGILVARQLQDGVECFMRIQRDPLFGPVVLFGLGGVFVEMLQDMVFRHRPFEVDEAGTMIRNIRGVPLLPGARGRPRADVAVLVRLLSDLLRFAWETGERLCSVDLNPVIALPEGQGAWAVDAVLEVREVADGTRS